MRNRRHEIRAALMVRDARRLMVMSERRELIEGAALLAMRADRESTPAEA
jgi:hypothetical protein